MNEVKFLQGLSSAYSSASKVENTFYYTTDDQNLYIGEKKLTNAEDLAAAILNITSNTSNITNIKEQLQKLTDGAGEGSIKSMIDTAVAEVEAKIGTLNLLKTTAKGNLVAAINELYDAEASGGVANHITMTEEPITPGMLKSYTLKQGEQTIGTIDIPKDMVIKGARVEEVLVEDTHPVGTYLVLTIQNAEEDEVWVNVGKLVDIYEVAEDTTNVKLTINEHKIKAEIEEGKITDKELADNAVTTTKIADDNITTEKILNGNVTAEKLASNAALTNIGIGTIEEIKLSSDLQEKINKAETALQESSITASTTSGTFKVNEQEIKIYGLKSAAYENTDAFESAGAAERVKGEAETYADGKLEEAKSYVDSKLTWGAIPE